MSCEPTLSAAARRRGRARCCRASRIGTAATAHGQDKPTYAWQASEGSCSTGCPRNRPKALTGSGPPPEDRGAGGWAPTGTLCRSVLEVVGLGVRADGLPDDVRLALGDLIA